MRGPRSVREAFAHRPWADRAACRESENPDAFFPGADQDGRTVYAKRVCSGCPVVAECLAWALENGMSVGVWGGLTEQERRAMKRKGAVA